MTAQKGKQNTQTRKESTMWPLLEDNRTSFQILNVRWHISKSIKYCIFNGLGSIPWPKGANRTGLDWCKSGPQNINHTSYLRANKIQSLKNWKTDSYIPSSFHIKSSKEQLPFVLFEYTNLKHGKISGGNRLIEQYKQNKTQQTAWSKITDTWKNIL